MPKQPVNIPTYEEGRASFPIAVKIILPTLGAIFLTCIALFMFQSHRHKVEAVENLTLQLETYATSKAAELSEPLWNFQDDVIARLMRSYRDNHNIEEIALFDAQGVVIAKEDCICEIEYTQTFTTTRFVTRMVGDETLELGRVEVTFHNGHLIKELAEHRRADILFGGVVLATLGLAVWLSVHLLVGRPLKRVKESIRDNALKHERNPLLWNTRDELGDVVAAYNRLLREVEERTGKLTQVNDSLSAEVGQRRKAEAELAKAHDELEQKVAQRTLELRRVNNELIELDQQRAAFLSSASHELRTPLAAILGFASLIRKNFSKAFGPIAGPNGLDGKAETILNNLDIIGKEGDRLTRLIDDLLDLNKIESGRMVWRNKPIDVAAELRRAADTMSGPFERNDDLELVQAIPESLPTLEWDPDRFQQVVINLMSNAVKHTPSGVVRLEAESLDGFIQIRVIDTGKGIPADDLQFIFHKFYQSGSGDTFKPKGTGLGLPICKNIVDHYGGDIFVSSEPGVGSAFTVELPVAPPRDQAA